MKTRYILEVNGAYKGEFASEAKLRSFALLYCGKQKRKMYVYDGSILQAVREIED